MEERTFLWPVPDENSSPRDEEASAESDLPLAITRTNLRRFNREGIDTRGEQARRGRIVTPETKRKERAMEGKERGSGKIY